MKFRPPKLPQPSQQRSELAASQSSGDELAAMLESPGADEPYLEEMIAEHGDLDGVLDELLSEGDAGAPPVAVVPAEPVEIPGIDEWNRTKTEWDMQLEWQAEVAEAKERLIEADQALAAAQGTVKACREEQKEALAELNRIQQRGPLPVPQPNTAGGDAGSLDPQPGSAPPAANTDESWRKAPLSELGLKPALFERLTESGISTIGQLEDLRAEISQLKAKWPKGIGAAKITQIEDAVIEWLSKHRDAAVLRAASGEVKECNTTPPTDETAASQAKKTDKQPDPSDEYSPLKHPSVRQWDKMTEKQQTKWIEARAKELGQGDVSLDAVEAAYEAIYQQGADAYGEGDELLNCEYKPGRIMDAWILGWLAEKSADESDEEDESELVETSEGE